MSNIMIDKSLYDKLLNACKESKTFYENCFEVTGGCDHSVGVCECHDREQYRKLIELIDELECTCEAPYGNPALVANDCPVHNLYPDKLD